MINPTHLPLMFRSDLMCIQYLCVLICIGCTLGARNIHVHSMLHLGILLCGSVLHKRCVFMYPSPGVKRTFPHIPICGTEFPGVEQEAGTVLLVAFPGRPPPDRAPLVWTQHLVDGGAVLVSQGGRGCITVLLGIWRGRWRQSKGGTMHRRIIVIFSFLFFFKNAFRTFFFC